MIRRPPRSTQSRSSAASDVYKRQASSSGAGASTPTSSTAGEASSTGTGASSTVGSAGSASTAAAASASTASSAGASTVSFLAGGFGPSTGGLLRGRAEPREAGINCSSRLPETSPL